MQVLQWKTRPTTESPWTEFMYACFPTLTRMSHFNFLSNSMWQKKYKRTTFERMIRARTSRTIRNIDARNRNLQAKTIPTIAQIYWATSENTCNMQNVYDNPRDTVTEVYELKIGESKREHKTLKKIIELPNYYNEFRKKTE